MKLLEVTPRSGKGLYGAMVRKQAEIRRGGRGTFSRVGSKKRKSVRWSHVRYKGSISLKPGEEDAVNVEIRSPDEGDEGRLLSSVLGWLDRHFGDQMASVNIRYQPPARRSR
jgi:hypothetical protein